MVSQSATCKISTRCASAFCPRVCPAPPPKGAGTPWRPLVPGATHVDCTCRDYASCPSHTGTHTHTYTPGQLYVESGQLRGLRFKNISKCDASVFYLRKCLAQTQRYKYIHISIYIYLCVHVCVCVKCAVFCIAWRSTYLAAISFCQFHVRNYKLSGEYPIWFILSPLPYPVWMRRTRKQP